MTSFSLKILGIITMFIDHLGLLFFPTQLVYRMIGRIAFPIFAFQLSEGYFHSKNKEKHIFKMILFGILSQIPFTLFLKLANPSSGPLLNIGFTLTLGLLCMYAWDKIKNPILKVLTSLFVCLLTRWIPVDYGFFGVLLCFLFYLFRNDKILCYSTVTSLVISKLIIENHLFKLPMLLALIPIYFYNGKKGHEIKNLFYLFYPLHMLIFSVIYINM